MSEFDSYFTNDDKPFSENINDALLLSNVFDMTVPIELPTMFNNGEFVDTTGRRKCSVAITQIVDNTDLTINAGSIVGTGSLDLKFYPNFNSYGSISRVDWVVSSGTVTVDIYDANDNLIASDIPNGALNVQSTSIKTLQNFKFRLNFTSATLTSFKVTMVNKDTDRWGAEVGISDVTGLQDDLDAIQSDINDITNNNKDWQDIPTYQFLDGTLRGMIRNGFAVIPLGVTANQNVNLPTELFELPPDFNPSERMELSVRMYKSGTDRIATIDLHSVDDDYYATLRTGTILESGAGVTGTLVYPISDY